MPFYKLKFLLLPLILVFSGTAGFGQRDVTRDTVNQLEVNDSTIFQLLDSAIEMEMLQPYFGDTSLSLFINIFFCSDRNCTEFGKFFITEVHFQETVAEFFEYPVGVFSYRGINVFVMCYLDLFSSYHMRLMPESHPLCPEPYGIVYVMREFPQQFTMLTQSQRPPRVYSTTWDYELEMSVIYGGSYQFYMSRYVFADNKWSFMDYFPIPRQTE